MKMRIKFSASERTPKRVARIVSAATDVGAATGRKRACD